MSETVYSASVYTRTVTYTNFQGVEQSVQLYFALDPIQLLQFIAAFKPKATKSKNPAKQGDVALTDAEQIKLIRDLAQVSAGFPSDDGESWEPFENFNDSLAGKAFMTKLATSDEDRTEFAQKVVMDPFRAFVGFAKADKSNTATDVQNLERMLGQIESVFAPADKNESIEDRRARLEAELAAMQNPTTES
jgi:hypothetical protein